MSETVLIDRHDGWTQVTLNRPERLNAFDDAMQRALTASLAHIAADDACRAVLLTGAGRGFCAGQDLAGHVVESEPDLGEMIEAFYNPLVRRIRGMRKPVVCAVNGVAAGAGANLAFACDIVLAARSAKFIQAFAKIGLVPDCGGTFFLPRLVGDARARALALLGEAVSAEQAMTWGMIWKMTEDATLLAQASELTARLAAAPTQGLALIKAALNASPNNDLDTQLDLERDLQRRAGRTPDYAEGVRAFIEKRPAAFTGKPP